MGQSNWAQAARSDSFFNLGVDLTGFENIHRWHDGIAGRDAVQAAVDCERRLIVTAA
jgi:hypothetical protein